MRPALYSALQLPRGSTRANGWLEPVGLWLKRNRRWVARMQWGVVGLYAVLLVVPAVLPLPASQAHIWDNVTLFAQFLFWGIWWPGVLISVVLFGRLWCGVLCPEGALSAYAARHSLGRAVPRWMRWPGWPFTAFALTTVYGQMISVYQYPLPALLILGGSTVAAVAVGYLYGRDKRVWCRYLCPVNGVFGLLAKLAPMHYAVDRAAWDSCPSASARLQAFNCEPMVAVRTMQSASPCHMCGRCAGFRDAVTLQPRLPGAEITAASARGATLWDSLLILVGLIGIAAGAFQWSASPWFVALKQAIATRLIDAAVFWPLETTLPWWLLTNYAPQSDVLTVLDGAVMLAYIGAAALLLGLATALPLAAAVRLLGRWRWQSFHHLAQGLIPLAACGVILGLSGLTVTMLRAEGLLLPGVAGLRAGALAGAALWSAVLLWRIAQNRAAAPARRALAAVLACGALLPPVASWVLLFWVW